MWHERTESVTEGWRKMAMGFGFGADVDNVERWWVCVYRVLVAGGALKSRSLATEEAWMQIIQLGYYCHYDLL